MVLVLAAALLAQALLTPVDAYISGDVLTTTNNTYAVTWGHNCGAIPDNGQVVMWTVDGVPDQVALAPVAEDETVNTVIATGDDTVQSQMCSALLAPAQAIAGPLPVAQGGQ